MAASLPERPISRPPIPDPRSPEPVCRPLCAFPGMKTFRSPQQPGSGGGDWRRPGAVQDAAGPRLTPTSCIGWQNLHRDQPGSDRYTTTGSTASSTAAAGAGWYWTDTPQDPGRLRRRHAGAISTATRRSSSTARPRARRRASTCGSRASPSPSSTSSSGTSGSTRTLARASTSRGRRPRGGFQPVFVFDQRRRAPRGKFLPARIEGPDHRTIARPFAEAGFKAYMTRGPSSPADTRLMFRGGIDEVLFRLGFGVDYLTRCARCDARRCSRGETMLRQMLASSCGALMTTGCASACGPADRAGAGGAERPGPCRARRLRPAAPAGSQVRVERTDGDSLRGTLMKATPDAIVVQKNTRVPEAPVEVPLSERDARDARHRRHRRSARTSRSASASGVAATFGSSAPGGDLCCRRLEVALWRWD